MSENPLLPHARLRGLHALMVRTRELERKHRAKAGAREALLAATAIHLLPGDLLCGKHGDPTAESLAPAGKTAQISGYVLPPVELRIQAAAGIAAGLKGSGTDGLVLTYAAAGTPEPGWQSGLAWAQESHLPLLFACLDATGGAAKSSKQKEPLTWAAMTRFARQIQLPVLAVDGEDAVAVYRVMQESVMRSRFGGGPAVIWAVATPPKQALTRSQQPLARLEKYLAVRNIKLPAKR